MNDHLTRRRDFLRSSLQACGMSSLLEVVDNSKANGTEAATAPAAPQVVETPHATRAFSGRYEGEYLNQIAFPLGGMGAGAICLEGTGALSGFFIRHRGPSEASRNVFAALSIRSPSLPSRVLEGPVPLWKLRPDFSGQSTTKCLGLPRFHSATFRADFPFATVDLSHSQVPLDVTLTGWSPFSPGDADCSSLPVGALEYTFTNRTDAVVEALFSFNSENFLTEAPFNPVDPNPGADRIVLMDRGFVLYGPGPKDRPWDDAHCAIWIDNMSAEIVQRWPLDSLSIFWEQLSAGKVHAGKPSEDPRAAGASILLPFTLKPGEKQSISVRLAWYVPTSNLYEPEMGMEAGKSVPYTTPEEKYRPWYSNRFPDIASLASYWEKSYQTLRLRAVRFSEALRDSTLPPEVLEAVSSNLCILKSPTVLRQQDGRLWGWEGTVETTSDRTGISGTSTHVWNYSQTIPHLFPQLERGLRETEFGSNQEDSGLQYCRTPLPIRPVDRGHVYPDGPAADGQLGGIIKLYREWRISGDTRWLRSVWPRARASLDFCIRTWDPKHKGCIEEPHLTTFDLEFWGADSLCASLYLGALKAATLICASLEEPAPLYADLLRKCQHNLETRLFNGEYFVQDSEFRHLRARPPTGDGSGINGLIAKWCTKEPAMLELLTNEGPIGQYRSGCLSDGILGEWLSLVSGLDESLDMLKVKSHLAAVRRFNLKMDLSDHPNFGRACFGAGTESGVVVCSWPRGGRPTWPILYSDEVWTGTEYQVASHLIWVGCVDAGLEIVRAVRNRYDGRVRNPFAEVEAGHWYARAMSSYALLQALSGARYDAVDKLLYLRPRIPGDFRCFLCTATGFGTVGVKNGTPFVDVASGEIPYREIRYSPHQG